MKQFRQFKTDISLDVAKGTTIGAMHIRRPGYSLMISIRGNQIAGGEVYTFDECSGLICKAVIPPLECKRALENTVGRIFPRVQQHAVAA